MGRDVSYKKLTCHGSINVPIAMRRQMALDKGDALSMELTEGNKILISPYIQRCHICGTEDNVLDVKGIGICTSCAVVIAEKKNEKEEQERGDKPNLEAEQ